MNVASYLLGALGFLPSRWVSGAVQTLSSNRPLRRALSRWQEKELGDLSGLERVLLIADVNLGDSVNLQTAARVVKHHFPGCWVDYLYCATAEPLVENNPGIDGSYPLFTGRFIPTSPECDRVRDLIREGSHDLVLSFSPFLPNEVLEEAGCPVLRPLEMICEILSRQKQSNGVCAHLIRNLAIYLDNLLSPHSSRGPMATRTKRMGPVLHLPPDLKRRTRRWCEEKDIHDDGRIVFWNPDASNRYTMVDETVQVALIERILKLEACDRLLLGCGFTYPGIQARLLKGIAKELHCKVLSLTRELPIDLYAGLTDVCRVFVTADTGPMHIAAARKFSAGEADEFRNRTSVVGLFGPTLPRVYGYDSSRHGFFPANQDAPSRVFEARCGEKSLICSLERVIEGCGGHRCFQAFPVDAAMEFITGRLSVLDDEMVVKPEDAVVF
jgi:ADP-heptose:LPS heptosyltransferase